MRKIYLAGIGNSGPQHWQRIWHTERNDGTWVEHSDWDVVSRDAWVEQTHRTLQQVVGPVILIGHSLGCLLAAEYLAQHGTDRIAAAFLVAVPDVTGPAFPREATGFRPAEELSMPVPSTLVASSNDPYGSIEHARRVAAHWGSKLEEVGAAGHINSDSKFGTWPQGTGFFEQLVQSLKR